MTIQNRTDSVYDTESDGQLQTESLQVGSSFSRYVLSKNCLRLVEKARIKPLSASANRTPLLPEPQSGLHYTLTGNVLHWSIGHISFGSAKYNRKFQIVSGTLNEPLGGAYTYRFTQSYPSELPQSDFAAPKNLCAVKS